MVTNKGNLRQSWVDRKNYCSKKLSGCEYLQGRLGGNKTLEDLCGCGAFLE